MFVFQSGKAGSFLSPTAFIVKDQEQEKKFSFCLLESLKVASSQPLLQVTPSHPYLFLLCFVLSSLCKSIVSSDTMVCGKQFGIYHSCIDRLMGA